MSSLLSRTLLSAVSKVNPLRAVAPVANNGKKRTFELFPK